MASALEQGRLRAREERFKLEAGMVAAARAEKRAANTANSTPSASPSLGDKYDSD